MWDLYTDITKTTNLDIEWYQHKERGLSVFRWYSGKSVQITIISEDFIEKHFTVRRTIEVCSIKPKIWNRYISQLN